MKPPKLRFTYSDAESAYNCWKFNCGPAAFCAVLGRTPAAFSDLYSSTEFKGKGYTNPTLMRKLLGQAMTLGWLTGIQTVIAGANRFGLQWPSFGLARIQWGGPWTDPGVPMVARYRKTHWVGSYREEAESEADEIQGPLAGIHVFDVNALQLTEKMTVLGVAGWIRLEEWARALVPELLQGYPRASGEWWITHAIEVFP